MLLGPRRVEPILLQPVTDRRFVFADALADRLEREPIREASFEMLLVHGGIIASAADRKMRR